MKFKDEATNKRIVFSADAQLSVKAQEQADSPTTLTGYALVWNVLSSDRGGYVVRLMPGSAVFAARVLALYEHDQEILIGNSTNGTVRWSSDDVGMKVEIDLPSTTDGADVAELVAKKYVTGMSFSMAFGIEDGETVTENGQQIINANKYTVDEVTITATPAFKQTSIAVKEPADQADQKENESEEKESLSLSAKVDLDRLRLHELD